MGDVVGAHALGGLIRVRAYHPPAPSLAPGRHVMLAWPEASREARVRSAAPHGRGLVLVALDGVSDRTAAEALVGARVLVAREDLPPADENEFYYHEVEGFRVDTAEGRPLGVITKTFSTGLNDVWVVTDGQREHLIPVIADVVTTIDRDAGRVVVEPIPGLLD